MWVQVGRSTEIINLKDMKSIRVGPTESTEHFGVWAHDGQNRYLLTAGTKLWCETYWRWIYQQMEGKFEFAYSFYPVVENLAPGSEKETIGSQEFRFWEDGD